MKLNLGCNAHKIQDWINIDFNNQFEPDVIANILKLPFPDNSVDEIYAGHVLEHFEWTETPLQEWFRVLKPRGKITICVPDINRASTMCDDGMINREWLSDLCFGMVKRGPGNLHYRAYTPRVLREEFAQVGFREVKHLDPRVCPLLQSGIIEQLVMEGIKP